MQKVNRVFQITNMGKNQKIHNYIQVLLFKKKFHEEINEMMHLGVVTIVFE